MSEELRLAWVADAQHFPWMCGPGRRDGPPSETVPTVWEFQAGDPPVTRVSKNPQSSQQRKSDLNLKARGNQSQGPWLPGRPALPSPPSI